jgi:hypothetical protein
MNKPVVGGWWAMCCLHDLKQIRSADELPEITEAMEEFGAQCWPTLADALEDLEEDGDFERGIAFALRYYFDLPMSGKSVIRTAPVSGVPHG